MTPDESLSSPTDGFPAWQHAYAAVLKASDTDQLFKLVEVAEAAVLTRLAQLEGSTDHHSERQVLAKAREKLLTVKREQLRFRQE